MPIHCRWRRLPRCPSANFSRSRESPTDWLHARQNSGTRRLEPFPKSRTSLQPSSRLTQKNPQITQITLIEKIKKSVAHGLRFAFFKFPPDDAACISSAYFASPRRYLRNLCNLWILLSQAG